MSRISPEKSKFAQTCNLLSHYVKEKGSLRDLNIDINGGVSAHNNVKKPMNLFMHDAIRITSSRENTLKNGQMTIIYGGQVLVFNDICAVKANEVMQLASKSVGPSNTTIASVTDSNASKLVQAQPQPQLQPIWLDLPIARRASLHRFLSKRKDRASSRGPYQLHKPSADSPKELFDLNL